MNKERRDERDGASENQIILGEGHHGGRGLGMPVSGDIRMSSVSWMVNIQAH